MKIPFRMQENVIHVEVRYFKNILVLNYKGGIEGLTLTIRKGYMLLPPFPVKDSSTSP
jgi:hypothetical protein